MSSSRSALRPLLRGAFGEPYLYVAETSSTQDVLRDGDHPHGAVALAEHQTAGRGRSGRTLGGRARPRTCSSRCCSSRRRRAAAAALARRRARGGHGRSSARPWCPALVKWPNDVLVDGGKVAGILLEAAGGRVVCGIGINVNQADERAPGGDRASRRLAPDRRRARRSTGRRARRGAAPSSRAATASGWPTGSPGSRASSSGGTRSAGGASRERPVRARPDAIAADGRLTVVLDDGGTRARRERRGRARRPVTASAVSRAPDAASAAHSSGVFAFSAERSRGRPRRAPHPRAAPAP